MYICVYVCMYILILLLSSILQHIIWSRSTEKRKQRPIHFGIKTKHILNTLNNKLYLHLRSLMCPITETTTYVDIIYSKHARDVQYCEYSWFVIRMLRYTNCDLRRVTHVQL